MLYHLVTPEAVIVLCRLCRGLFSGEGYPEAKLESVLSYSSHFLQQREPPALITNNDVGSQHAHHTWLPPCAKYA
jgi:hypothetical protein